VGCDLAPTRALEPSMDKSVSTCVGCNVIKSGRLQDGRAEWNRAVVG